MTVGVLALQGSFNEHLAALKRIGVKGVQIRKPDHHHPWWRKHHHGQARRIPQSGKPVGGTCAGLIFLADKAVGGQELVGGLDCTVHRNFFGSQIQSFEADLLVPELAATEGGPSSFRGVFIRAPAILETGPDVQVLADYAVPPGKSVTLGSDVESQAEKTGREEKVIVAVKQGNLLATAFHPELTTDTRWHSFFLKMVGGDQSFFCDSSSNGDDGEQQQAWPDLPVFQ